MAEQKKHPMSLRPTEEAYELSETMAKQRGIDRAEQDHRAHRDGLILEAVRGPAVNGRFGTLLPEELDEYAIPLYIALGGYLKRRGKLPMIFGEGPGSSPERTGQQGYQSEQGREKGSTEGPPLTLDEEAETAFSSSPDPM